MWLPLEERQRLDSVKGVLILLVVLGHSLLAGPLIPGLREAVYSFHVQCFLLLPFLFPAPALTRRNTGNLLVRYLVPYAGAILLFSMLHAVWRGAGLGTWIVDVGRAVVTGNTNDLKRATGFYLLWFLPALSVTVLLWMVYFRLGRWFRWVLVVLALAAHLFLPGLPWPYRRDWPAFGTHIALFIFPLGLWVHYGARPLLTRLSGKGRLLLLSSLIGSLWLLLARGLQVNLAHLGYSSGRHVSALAHQDLVAVLALLSLLAFSGELARIPYLAQIGNKSLPIYLLHQPFVAGVVHGLGGQAAPASAPIHVWLVAGFSVLCGVVGPLLMAKLIYSRARLRSLLFPRSARDLLYGFGVVTQPGTSGILRAGGLRAPRLAGGRRAPCPDLQAMRTQAVPGERDSLRDGG